MSDGERYSLFGLLMEGIKTEEITPYEYTSHYRLERSLFKANQPGRHLRHDSGGDTISDNDGEFPEVWDRV